MPEMIRKQSSNAKKRKPWAVIRDVAPDMRVFDVLSYPKFYHNLKAAVKEVCTRHEESGLCSMTTVRSRAKRCTGSLRTGFLRLPGNMGRTAQEALDLLLHTGDGQLCDIMIDRAALDAIERRGASRVRRSLRIMRTRWLLLRTSRLPCVPRRREKGCRFHEKCHGGV